MPERQNNLEAKVTTPQVRKKLGHSAFVNFRDLYNARRAEAMAPDFIGAYVKTRSNRLKRSDALDCADYPTGVGFLRFYQIAAV